jgi:hypothetical protein
LTVSSKRSGVANPILVKASASLGLLTLALTGCAAESSEWGQPEPIDVTGFQDVTAVLDSETESIQYPIDAYFLDDVSSMYLGPDRNYGLWGVENAQNFGYDYPTFASDIDEAESKNASLSSQAWDTRLDECYASEDLFPLLGQGHAGGGVEEITAPANRVIGDAFTLAREQPEWDTAVSEWRACLEQNGVVPNPDPENWTPELPSGAEQEYRAAAIDVNCKIETRLVARLADLESQYQAALIEKYQGPLNELVTQENELMVRVDEILSTG